MKVLLDENLPHDLRQALSNFDTATTAYMGWGGLGNGELLKTAEHAGFDVFVTGDKTVQFEQNLGEAKIAIISLSAPHWPLIKDHVDQIAQAIGALTPGSFKRLNVGRFRRGQKPKPPTLG